MEIRVDKLGFKLLQWRDRREWKRHGSGPTVARHRSVADEFQAVAQRRTRMMPYAKRHTNNGGACWPI